MKLKLNEIKGWSIDSPKDSQKFVSPNNNDNNNFYVNNNES